MHLFPAAGTPVPGHALPDAPRPVTEEGARYALLQRLVPALHHQIMGNFQSIDMLVVMMERRLQPAVSDMVELIDLAGLRQDCAMLGSASHTAVQSVVDLMAWIRPRLDSTAPLESSVADCTSLLQTELQFRGFALVNNVRQTDTAVSSGALRSVLCAALIALSDLSQVPASVVMRAEVLPGHVMLSVDLTPLGEPLRKAVPASYRLLRWADVEALAAAGPVELVRTDTGARLIFATPLT